MTLHERPAAGKYRLRIEDYERLAESGAFGDARSELIDGEIIVMAPEYRQHAYVREELAYRMRRALEAFGSSLYVGSGSVRLDDNDMPQPDIVLTSEPRGTGPTPVESVALLVEVASTTLSRDLGQKAAIYAQSAIAEYWVVDGEARVIHQMWSPDGESYAERREMAFGEPLVAATVEGLAVETTGI